MKYVVLALALASCGGEWISRREAYERDTRNCEVRHADEDGRRGCLHLVELRHAPYWQSGGYPDRNKIPRPER